MPTATLELDEATEEIAGQPVPKISEELVDLGWHPIFAEHIDREGNVFDDAAIRGLVDSNNHRVDDTGDFCPLVIRHRQDGAENSQEVVGFAGPYKYGKIGKKSPKGAVLAHLRVYRRDLDKAKKFPRTSVELWSTKSNPTVGTFDPICLLGSETPELDLGLIHYAKAESGETTRRCYQAAYPGGSNTFVPSMAVGDCGDDHRDKEKVTKYEHGGSLSPADIQQIVAALKPVVQEAVDTAVAQIKPADNLLDGGLDGLDDSLPGDATDPDATLGDMDGDGDIDANDLAMIDEDGDGDFDAQDADLDDDFDADDDGKDDDFDDLSSDDDEAGDFGEEVNSSSDDGGDKRDYDKSPAKKYSKLSAGDGLSSDLDSENGNMADAPAKPDANETPEKRLARYQRERDEATAKLTTVTKERDELRTKYQKEVEARRNSDTELTEVKERVGKLESSERRAVRYQKLTEKLNVGYVFDIEEEIEDCVPMTDDQFTRHLDRIVARYSKVPLPGVNTSNVPIPDAKRLAAATKDDQKRARYAKVATDNCTAARVAGEPIEFKAEFERLMKEDPEKIAA